MTTPYQASPLAQRLKAARGTMLSKDLAAHAGWTPSKVTKIERGRQLPTVDDLNLWAAISGATDQELGEWIAMLEQLQATNRSLADALRSGQQNMQEAYSRMIDETRHFQFYEKLVIPRFLQVPGYTRGIAERAQREYGDAPLDSPEGQRIVAETVAKRQETTRHLYDTDRTFELLIDEAVLRTWRFSPDVMRTQLLRLLDAVDMPNVRFGIYPQNTFVTEACENSFEIYTGPDIDVVCVETATGDTQHADPETVNTYREQMRRLWTEAITGPRARHLIGQIVASIPRDRAESPAA